MSEAARLGTTVVAEEQTAGQGRHGHTWHSEAGAGLYASMVLRPEPLLTLALGLATAEAIRRSCGIACDLRWPNDVLIGERKVAGILVQLVDSQAIAGIGINVNHDSFPAEIAGIATSLRIATGRAQSREDLLVALIESVESFRRPGREEILAQFTRASSYAEGKRVRIDQPGRVVTGTTAGLDSDGYLRVRRDDGAEVRIVAGGVRAAGTGCG